MKNLLISIGAIIILLIAITLVVNQFLDRRSAPELEDVPFASDDIKYNPETDEYVTVGYLTYRTPEAEISFYDPRNLPHVNDIGLGMHQWTGTETDEDAGFAMIYSEQDDSFSIAITKLPIGRYHEEASEYFANTLRITHEEACLMDVHVSTPFDIEPNLSGQNFGLSYCEGALDLEE